MRYRPYKAKEYKRHRSNITNAMIAVSIVLSIILIQILLSVATASGAYEIADLKDNLKELDRDYSKLSMVNSAFASPQYLAEQAEKLGMVSGTSPAFLRLSDGAVIGSPTKASADDKLIVAGVSVPNAMLEKYKTQYADIVNMGANTATTSPTESSPVATPSPFPTKLEGNIPAIQTH